LAQIYLYEKAFAKIGGEIYVKVLPKKLDEEVASDMVAGFGGVITKLVQPFDAQNDCSFKIKF
jgi:adenosylhomocysteinase